MPDQQVFVCDLVAGDVVTKLVTGLADDYHCRILKISDPELRNGEVQCDVQYQYARVGGLWSDALPTAWFPADREVTKLDYGARPNPIGALDPAAVVNMEHLSTQIQRVVERQGMPSLPASWVTDEISPPWPRTPAMTATEPVFADCDTIPGCSCPICVPRPDRGVRGGQITFRRLAEELRVGRVP